MYDLAIVGGGPAGATLARLLGGKLKILLLERRSFGDPAQDGLQKCCGGLLDPDAQKMLAYFGLGLPGSIMVSPQMFAVRTIDMDNGLERYYQRHYINIDREKFDAWLESLLPTSVDLVCGATYLSHVTTAEGIELSFSRGGRMCRERARLLVGADGALSKVRRASLGQRAAPKRYVAIQEWFHASAAINYYGAIFDSATTDFYSWVIPKDECLILGSALAPGREAQAKFESLKGRLASYGFDFSRSVRKNGTWLLRPSSTRELATGTGPVALVGEAAGFISPSSAEGISYAMRSSLALAEAISAGGDWQAGYRHNARKLLANIALKNLKAPFMYNSLLRKAIMKSGLQSIGIHSNPGQPR